MKSIKAVLAIAAFSAGSPSPAPAPPQSESSFYIRHGRPVHPERQLFGVDGCDNTRHGVAHLGGYQLIAISPPRSDTTTSQSSGSCGRHQGQSMGSRRSCSYPLTKQFSIYGKLGGYTASSKRRRRRDHNQGRTVPVRATTFTSNSGVLPNGSGVSRNGRRHRERATVDVG